MRANEQGRVHGLSSLSAPPRLLCSPFHRRKRCSESSRLPRFRDAGGFLLAPFNGMVGSDALQAIVYARGSLRLLDQVRRLLLGFLSFLLPCFVGTGGMGSRLGLIHSGLALIRRRGSCRSRWTTSTSRAPPMAGARAGNSLSFWSLRLLVLGCSSGEFLPVASIRSHVLWFIPGSVLPRLVSDGDEGRTVVSGSGFLLSLEKKKAPRTHFVLLFYRTWNAQEWRPAVCRSMSEFQWSTAKVSF